MNNKNHISPPDSEDDPFLRDAQEGWSQFPGARSGWWKKKLLFSAFLMGKSWKALPAPGKLAFGTLSSVTIIAVAAVTIPFNFSPKEKVVAQQEQSAAPKTSTSTGEKMQEEISPEQINIETAQHVPVLFDGFIPFAGDQTSPVYAAEAEAKDEMVAEADMETTTTFFSSGIISDSDNAINRMSTKKSEIQKSPDDALSYIWVGQYRMLDYETLGYSGDDKTKPAAASGSLDTRFSNASEKADVPPSVSYDTVPYKTFVSNAATQLKLSNYDDAEYQFKKLLVQRPADENALFYLGYCAYKKGEYAKALSYFEQTRNSQYKAFGPDADYFTARVYLLTNERTKARNLLRKIAKNEGLYQQEADELLEKEFHE